MDYPTLPTDNLYKFIALAGLALVLVSLTYPVGKIVELELGTAETKSQKARFDIEISEINRLLEKLEKAKDPTPQDVSALRDRHVQSQIKAVEIKKSIEIAEIQLEWAKYYLSAAKLGAILGALAAFFGFLFWYLRVQRPNDLLLLKPRDKSA